MTDGVRGDRSWGTPRELLVVLGPDPGLARGALRTLADWGELTGRLPPRLALVVLPADRQSDAAGLAGVAGVFPGEVPPALRETFSPGEQLFVDGWLTRGEPKPPRPGEGRPWADPPDAGDRPRGGPDC